MIFRLFRFRIFKNPIVWYVSSLYVTAWKVSKYGVFSGPNTGKYEPEKTLDRKSLDTFLTVGVVLFI